jgi:Domain of unknown function DUF11
MFPFTSLFIPNVRVQVLCTLLFFAMFGSAFAQSADLSLRVSLPKAIGRVGDTVQCEVVLLNEGRSLVEKTTIQVTQTDALKVISHTTNKGSYDRGSGVWFIPDFKASEARGDLKITYVLIGSGPSAVSGEITTCSQPDRDSKPNNSEIHEDDIGYGTITVPMVVCGDLPIDITAFAMPGYKQYQWKRNESLLPGETNQSLRIKEPGNYTYLITDSERGNAFSAPIIVERSNPSVDLGDPVEIVAGSPEFFIKPEVDGGLEPYKYKWTNDINWDMKRPLKKGQTMQLKVRVTDRRGCHTMDAVTVVVK